MQVRDELAHRRVPSGRVLLHRARDRPCDVRRHRFERTSGHRIARQDLARDVGAAAAPRQISKEQLVRQHPPGELIGAAVDDLAAQLLRSHVRERSGGARALRGAPRRMPWIAARPRRRRAITRRLGGRRHRARDAEVHHLGRAVVANHHVLRLDVPVDHAALVRGRQRLRHFEEPHDELLQRRPAPRHARPQRFAGREGDPKAARRRTSTPWLGWAPKLASFKETLEVSALPRSLRGCPGSC